jgi:excinuclease UvrABC nuclease subunit
VSRDIILALLRRFRNLEKIQESSIDDLLELKEISEELARSIRERLGT